MQGDAFPTPPIYSHRFDHIVEDLPPSFPPNLLSDRRHESDMSFQNLFSEIDLLMTDCSEIEAKSFWVAANRIKIKHQIMASMQKIERLFLDLAEEATDDPDLVAAVSDSLLYSSHSKNLPNFLKSPKLVS